MNISWLIELFIVLAIFLLLGQLLPDVYKYRRRACFVWLMGSGVSVPSGLTLKQRPSGGRVWWKTILGSQEAQRAREPEKR